MINKNVNWSNIKNLKEHQISYLLYKEGKSISLISSIRNIDKNIVEKHIIRCKLEIFSSKNEDILIKLISMDKSERLNLINKMDDSLKDVIANEIYKRYTKFKDSDDRVILLWIIGELKNKKLLPFLRMELKSRNVNFRRLSCSALGKIKSKETKEWLEKAVNDSNSQVRQYAIKALGEIGDRDTIKILQSISINENEKHYVIRAANESIKKLNSL